MALHWTVQSHLQLVTVVAEGDVTRSDVEAYLDMVIGANIVDWRGLFDARNGRAIFTDQHVNELGGGFSASWPPRSGRCGCSARSIRPGDGS